MKTPLITAEDCASRCPMRAQLERGCDLQKMSIAELQELHGRVLAALQSKVCGDPREVVSVPVGFGPFAAKLWKEAKS